MYPHYYFVCDLTTILSLFFMKRNTEKVNVVVIFTITKDKVYVDFNVRSASSIFQSLVLMYK